MKVKAVRMGYDGLKRRRVDEVFDWPEGMPLGSWAVPVDPSEAKAIEAVELQRQRAEHARLVREQAGVSPVAQVNAELDKMRTELQALIKGVAEDREQLRRERAELDKQRAELEHKGAATHPASTKKADTKAPDAPKS